MILRIFNVEHGACAILAGPNGALAMIDCGHNGSSGWRPSDFIRNGLGRTDLDYLLVTNVDQDHISDLATFADSGITIRHMLSNTAVAPQTLRSIKEQCGSLTNDANTYLNMRTSFGIPGTGVPFNQAMGGINVSPFWHTYPAFQDTNNLSSVFFITYGSFKILFPGDVERAGWQAHLRNPYFVQELRTTTILVASHHGRESGYCEEVFDYCRPKAIVMSDKSVVHDTQETGNKYRSKTEGGVRTTNNADTRFLLTTRSDGDIVFKVDETGGFYVTTGVT